MNNEEIIREAIAYTELWQKNHATNQIGKTIWTRKSFVHFSERLLAILRDEVQ